MIREIELGDNLFADIDSDAFGKGKHIKIYTKKDGYNLTLCYPSTETCRSIYDSLLIIFKDEK